MGFRFTEKQQKILDARGHNILVSAAAGSGKTAVLVERIVRMISEGDHPIDVDRLLVVTFTRAAAAQMRERIGKAISERILQNPGDRNLQRQETLLHHAQITTIDSFCTFLLRNNFTEIDLDPGFRQMDETEASLLESDVMEKYLERMYAEDTEDFARCIEYFCAGTDDEALQKLIMKLYTDSNAHPSQEGWLLQHLRDYDVADVDALLSSDWMRSMLEAAFDALYEIKERYAQMRKLCAQPGGPYPYTEFLENEENNIFAPFGIVNPEEDFAKARADLESGRDVAEIYQKLSLATGTTFERIPTISKKLEGIDAALKQEVQELRNAVKADLQTLHALLFGCSLTTEVYRMREASAALRTLIRLTLGYIEALKAAKRDKNVIDFSDLERYALQIMLEEHTDENGTYYVPRDAAKAYRSYFDEVLIDEYQDSNEVQELLLKTISGELTEGDEPVRYARFMVGDVKQSIYRFRNARPEIFVDKFDHYRQDDPQTERIDLDQNFRSRTEVLDSVNDIFLRIMRREVGGVAYDETVTLKPGADYKAPLHEDDYKTELLLVDPVAADTAVAGMQGKDADQQGGAGSGESAGKAPRDKEGRSAATSAEPSGEAADSDEESLAGASGKKLEALAIAAKIKEIVGKGDHEPLYVTDEETRELRPATYRDIVILLRAQSSWNDVLQEVFESAGIPIYIEHKAGYFAAEEIRQILQMLRVMDNPRQDIPLYGVLRGFFGKFTEDEIANIRAAGDLIWRNSCKQAAANADSGADEPAAEQTGDREQTETSEEDASEQTGAADQTTPPDLYDCLRWCAQADESIAHAKLAQKCEGFLSKLAELRGKVTTTPIHELLLILIEESGFGTYMAALPAGLQRTANLHLLIAKAMAFEQTAYTGLFQFLRYIDQMQQYDVDYGEANILDEKADVVRVMTIHKSKGLEFPICFVAGLATQYAFRRMDTTGPLVTDSDLGIGINYVDLTYRSCMTTLRKEAVVRKIRRDSLGEELRVLYVAMTRAKEKLFLVGQCKMAEKTQQALLEGNTLLDEDGMLAASKIEATGCYLNLILSALQGRCTIPVSVIHVGDLAMETTKGEIALGERLTDLLKLAQSGEAGSPLPSVEQQMARRFSYRYPHENLRGVYSKTTVTELKRAWMMADNDDRSMPGDVATSGAAELIISEPGVYIPRFALEEEAKDGSDQILQGAQRGTAIHRICELLDFAMWKDPAKITASAMQMWIDGMKNAGDIPVEYAASVRPQMFVTFLQSDLGRRMTRAAEAGTLHREQPFVYGVSAERVQKDAPKEETMLVQGVIDAYFIEEDPDGTRQIVLVDYKSDFVTAAQELTERYHVQLDLYAEALHNLLQLPVKEKLIYSFKLQQTIKL